jgi:sarcosine dehydrogenase
MKHAYVVTEKIPGIEKMPNVRDHDASVYLKLQVFSHGIIESFQ